LSDFLAWLLFHENGFNNTELKRWWCMEWNARFRFLYSWSINFWDGA